MNRLAAVSYTHLDVYKRQVYGGVWPRRHGLPVTDWIYTMSALKKLLAAALISTVLSSCSFGPTLEKDESARAIFDAENDQVILPLDAYNTAGKDEYFTKALELARKKCFACLLYTSRCV